MLARLNDCLIIAALLSAVMVLKTVAYAQDVDLEIEAKSSKFIEAEGIQEYEDATLSYNQFLVSAPLIRFKLETKEIFASGGISFFYADLFGWAETLATRIGEDTISMQAASLYESSSRFKLSSRLITINKDGYIEAEDCWFSTCHVPDPTWSLKSEYFSYSSDLRLITLGNASWSIKDVTILPIPVLAIPAAGTRESGILPPVIDFKTSSNPALNWGYKIGIPIYLAIDSEQDLVFTPLWIGNNRGLAFSGEYKFKFSQQNEGLLEYFIAPSQNYGEKPRYYFDYSQHLGFGDNMSLNMAYSLASDAQIYLELEDSTAAPLFQSYQADFSFFSHNFGLNAAIYGRHTFLDTKHTTRGIQNSDYKIFPQILPKVQLSFYHVPQFPLRIGLNMDGINFLASAGYSGQLYRLSPKLALSFNPFSSVTFDVELQQIWLKYLNIKANHVEEQFISPIAISDAKVELGFSLRRYFPNLDGSHRIDFKVKYEWREDVHQPLSGFINQSPNPSNAAVMPIYYPLGIVSFSIINHWIASHNGRLEVTQPYRTLRAKSSFQAGNMHFNQRITAQNQPLLPLKISFGWTKPNLVTFSASLSYHYQKKTINRGDSSLTLTAGGYNLKFSWTRNAFSYYDHYNAYQAATHSWAASFDKNWSGFVGGLGYVHSISGLPSIGFNVLVGYSDECLTSNIKYIETHTKTNNNNVSSWSVDRSVQFGFKLCLGS